VQTSAFEVDVGGVQMQDAPPGLLVAEQHSAPGEALLTPEVEGDEDESGAQWLDPQVTRNQPLVRGTARGARPNGGKNGAERGVNAARPGDAFRHLRHRLEDGRRIGEGGAERPPVEVFKRGQESLERDRHGRGVLDGAIRRCAAYWRDRLAPERWW